MSNKDSQDMFAYGRQFVKEKLAGRKLTEMQSPKFPNGNHDDHNVEFFHWPERPFYFTDGTRLYVAQGVPTAIGGSNMYEIEAVVLNRLFDSNSYNEATFRCFENPEQHGTHAYISKDDFLRIRDSVRKGVPVA